MNNRILKILTILLSASLMLMTLAACGRSDAQNQEAASAESSGAASEEASEESGEVLAEGETPAESVEADPSTTEDAGDFTWTRTGTFEDPDGNILMIALSDTPGYEGWSVSLVRSGEDILGWIIQQEGNTLHGDLDYEGNGDHVVTVTEFGEDGVQLVMDKTGDTYQFTPMELPEVVAVMRVNIEGFGQIAHAEEGQEVVFDDEFPTQSIYEGLAEPKTFTLEARPDEGCEFIKWTKDGEDYSEDTRIVVNVTEDVEYVAVFTYD